MQYLPAIYSEQAMMNYKEECILISSECQKYQCKLRWSKRSDNEVYLCGLKDFEMVNNLQINDELEFQVYGKFYYTLFVTINGN